MIDEMCQLDYPHYSLYVLLLLYLTIKVNCEYFKNIIHIFNDSHD